MGLLGKAIATAGPILISSVCSAASASGRRPSLPASIDQIASKPNSSAFLASAGTSLKERVEIPVSSFIDSLQNQPLEANSASFRSLQWGDKFPHKRNQ